MASEFDKKERMRNSRERLRELYHDEVSPGFRVPRMAAAKTLLVLSLLTLLLFSATLLFKFNYFITIQEVVLAKRGHLEGAYQRRSNLFENLLKLTLNHAALEHEVFSHVADVRKDIIKKLELPPEVQQAVVANLESRQNPSFSDISKALQGMTSGNLETSIGRLLGVVEQYPDIKSSETYKQMMDSLMIIEDRIAERRMEYQESIRQFNREISQFPWYILAKATGFKRFDYFYAERGAHIRPQIHADIFEQLLPMVRLGEGAGGHGVPQGETLAPPQDDPYKRLRKDENSRLEPIHERALEQPGLRTLETDEASGVSEDPAQGSE
ncbi:MAG: LemA family protein [Gammaproteobacteria bacterium SHHR-1]|uniref:magnetosome protein MamQ n=1 Tax=Magnetovirga frankeli TaxID=947516 RepID=UPI00029D27C3|nr:magnetosome protein [gamma proteobacterium SS-5]QFY89622.1 LemA family protein [gamma proteobacterium SS-5]